MTGRLPRCWQHESRTSPETRPAAEVRSVPIAYEDRLVLPDTLGTTIKLTSSATWGPARLAPTDYSQRGRCCHLYIGPAVVTCLEIRWPTGFWYSEPAPSRYSQPRAGRSATECEHGRGLSALAVAPNAD